MSAPRKRAPSKREVLTDRMVIASERTGTALDRMAELLSAMHAESKRTAENLELFARREPTRSVPPDTIYVTPAFMAKVERWASSMRLAIAAWRAWQDTQLTSGLEAGLKLESGFTVPEPWSRYATAHAALDEALLELDRAFNS